MTILVVAEHTNAALAAATLNTVAAAQKIGGDIHVLVAGANAGAAAEAAAADAVGAHAELRIGPLAGGAHVGLSRVQRGTGGAHIGVAVGHARQRRRQGRDDGELTQIPNAVVTLDELRRLAPREFTQPVLSVMLIRAVPLKSSCMVAPVNLLPD